jgi:hypothetical protein
MAPAMTEHDLPKQADGYREMAWRVRALSALAKHTDVQDQLGRVALQYEKLAECLDRLTESLRDAPSNWR